MRHWLSFVFVLGLASACVSCDRRSALAGRFGELVLVTGVAPAESLSREASVSAPPAAMGDSSSTTFLVRNIGDSNLNLTRIALVSGSPAFSVELPERATLAPSEEAVFTITFKPDQASDPTLSTVAHQAVFQLDSAGGRPGETQATIEVSAVAEARDCFVPALLDFGDSPIGQAVQIPIDLSNRASTPAHATVGAIGGPNPGFFTVDPPVSELDVAPGVAANAMIRFAPQTEDEVKAQLTVRRSPSCPQGTTQLVGRGSMQSLSWAPAEVNFGRVPLNETATRVVTFSNRSGAELPLTISTEGNDFATPVALGVLGPRTTTTVQVTCQPQSLSSLTGVLRVDVGTSPLLPVRVPLRCSGGGPRLRPSPNPLAFGTIPVLLDKKTNLPLAQVSQTRLVRRLRLENVGTPPPTPNDPIYNLTLGRDGTPPLMSLTPIGQTKPGEFTVAVGTYDPIGVPAVAGRNAVDVEVMVQPAATGLREALLTVYSNDAVRPVQEIRLTANAQAAERCAVGSLPAAILFGDLPPNGSETQTLTLQNTGTSTCMVSGLEIATGSHAGFSLANGNQITFIGAGQSVPVQVRFDSTGLATGTTATGFVRFSTPGSQPMLVPLSARVSQCLVAVPEELDFGNIKLGCRSAPRAVQLFNTCGSPVNIYSATTSGQGFAISGLPTIPSSGLVVQPAGNPVSISVVFGPPPNAGTFTGALSVVGGEGTSMRRFDIALKAVGDTTGITTETFQQPARPMTDILFTIDNSCSMSEEQTALSANFASFISYANTANVDYRIAITTTDDFAADGQGKFVSGQPTIIDKSLPNARALFESRVRVGTAGSGYERPLSTTLKALTEPLISGANAGLLRDDANLAIIIVTDAPDQSSEAIGYYETRLPLVKGPRRVHQVSVSVIGPFTPQSATCAIEGVDPGRYQALITRTGGVKANICTSNWAQDLEALGRSALGPRSTFFVRNPPDTQQPVDVQVNGLPVSSAWNYDGASNAIVFSQGQAPASGTTLTITYQSQCF